MTSPITPADFDAPDAASRIRAAQHFLDAPTKELVDAFCRRWSSPTNQCDDVRYNVDTDDDARRAASMAAYDDLNQVYTVAMKRLREHADGPSLVVAGLGSDGDRARTVCLKRLSPEALVGALERLHESDAAQALVAVEKLLAGFPDDHPQSAPLRALQGKWAPTKKTKKTKPKRKAAKPKADAFAAIIADMGNIDAATAEALAAAKHTKKRGQELADRLLFRHEPADAPGAARTLEAAWLLSPSKGAKSPASRVCVAALKLAVAGGDAEGIARWIERADAVMTPSQRKDMFAAGWLAPQALHPALVERYAPKLPASSKSIHEALRERLLPTLTLRAGSRLHAAQCTSAVGGIPWLPASVPWPTDAKGVPMQFLVQLRFDQIPALPGFPTQGMLLLFVPNDSTFGLRFGGEASEYAAVFLDDPEAEGAGDHYNVMQKCSSEGHRKGPLTSEPTRLDWHLSLQPPIPDDVRFDDVPGAADLKPKARQQLHDRFRNPQGFGGNHRLGGYAEFVQHEDPRRGDQAGYVHLLSLDSYDAWKLMFGDGGLAHFFIDPDDLEAKRFDRMLWFWDCA